MSAVEVHHTEKRSFKELMVGTYDLKYLCLVSAVQF